MPTVMWALITEQLVPSALGRLPNMMSTVILDFLNEEERCEFIYSCQLLSDAFPSHDGSPDEWLLTTN